jgi:DNA-binding CsgD family transcriptional regulator
VSSDLAPHDSRDANGPRLLAVGLVADDLSPMAIARYADVPIAKAAQAIADAHAAGLLTNGTIDDLTRARLIAELSRDEQARIHAAVARHLFASGPDHLPQAIHHIRAAGALGPSEPMVALATHGGRLNLSLGDYQAAYDLLSLADHMDSSTDLSEQGRRLCDLATATDGLGRVDEARRQLARAINLGELANDPALVARAAVMHTLPVDWYAGDLRTTAFLQRAESMDQEPEARVSIAAARALAEIRIPVTTPDGQQYAWVTRPAVAQPLAEQALTDSKDCDPEVQCLALMAWRTTHRAPEFLDRRREISTRTLDLAQKLRLPALQVEGAVWLAVDAIESGDRGLYDEALSVARWVSQTDGNPRLKWRALTLALGAALLDDDADSTQRLRAEAGELSDDGFSPGRFAVEMFFLGEELISRDDPVELATLRVADELPGAANPVVRAALGYIWARTGDPDIGVQQARRALRQLDPESSYLLVATRVAAVAHLTHDDDLARTVVSHLSPWANHVSVDGNGWWCDGPVSLWLAMLHHQLGDQVEARHYLDAGEQMARHLNDLRSLRRASTLRTQFLAHTSETGSHTRVDLTPRELAVLEMLATGATNPSIARTLAYSLSTIRNDTISIYRKMGVNGRPDAVAKALALGLVKPAR